MRHRRARGRAYLATALLLASAALVGCSGDPGPEPGAGGSSSAAAEEAASDGSSPYLEVPAGVSLTPPGSGLGLGEEAQVAWQPREGKVGALKLKVLEVEEVTLDEFSSFRFGDAVDSSTPYFVDVRVENVGDTSLADTGVPLYLLDSTDTLIERSTFAGSFEACPSAPLPATFAPGDVTRSCLVFLAPRRGEARAVSFRPTEEFDPITWTGEITEPRRGQRDQGQGQGSRDD